MLAFVSYANMFNKKNPEALLKRLLSFFCCISILLLFSSAISLAKPLTMAVAPFEIRSESGLDYLGTGMVDLFTSRLTVESKVIVKDGVKVTDALEKQSILTTATAYETAKKLGVDYLVFGNLKESTQEIRLKIFVVSTNSEAKMMTFSEKSSKYESADVILRLINRISEEIKKKVLNIEIKEKATVKQIVPKGKIHAHPDTLLDGIEVEDESGFFEFDFLE